MLFAQSEAIILSNLADTHFSLLIFRNLQIFKMIVKISGQSGYIGTVLKEQLHKGQLKVEGIPRSMLYEHPENLAGHIAGSDVIIHLSGASILKRWSSRNKKIISDSRLITTRNLVEAISFLPEEKRPGRIITASAIGLYRSGLSHTENSTDYDPGFVGKLVKDWEDCWKDLPDKSTLYILRIGLVLGKKAKTIRNLLPLFKAGLGGPVGNGKQAFPFIHEADLMECIQSCIQGNIPAGTYNLVAPEPVTNKVFTQLLASKLRRPAFLPVPSPILKIIFGEASVLLLKSPAVIPDKLIQHRFRFNYPDMNSALDEILS